MKRSLRASLKLGYSQEIPLQHGQDASCPCWCPIHHYEMAHTDWVKERSMEISFLHFGNHYEEKEQEWIVRWVLLMREMWEWWRGTREKKFSTMFVHKFRHQMTFIQFGWSHIQEGGWSWRLSSWQHKEVFAWFCQGDTDGENMIPTDLPPSILPMLKKPLRILKVFMMQIEFSTTTWTSDNFVFHFFWLVVSDPPFGFSVVCSH